MQRPAQTAKCDRVSSVWLRLQQYYGRSDLDPSGDPVAERVATILSQHTTDASASKAFTTLRSQFEDWQSIELASFDELAEVIRPAGLPVQKARTIKSALIQIGGGDLCALAELPVPEARAHLTAIRGVGDKTASCVLLFALGMPAHPVDTHIERLSKRIGISGAASSATGIQHVLECCLPADGATMYAFHVGMVRHGREICQARVPKCSSCVLTDLCDYYARMSGARPPLDASPFEGSAIP